MDKKTLEALNNFALSLEALVESFEKRAEEEEAYGGMGQLFSKQQDLENTLVRISDSLEKIEENDKKILSKQNEILKLSKDIKKDNDSKGLFSFNKGESAKESIKTGVSSILLIATGVMAMGLAFKMVGDVNIGTVLSLSIALPILTATFILAAQYIKEKEIELKDIGYASLTITTMSIALVAASYILQLVKPVGAEQIITTIGISVAFAMMGTSIGRMVEGVKDVKPEDVLNMPIVLVTMSLSIVASSYLLNMVQPVGLPQMITAIAISVAFVILAYSIKAMVTGLKNVKTADVLILPLALVTMSAAVAFSSDILASTTPIDYSLLLNIAAQSLVLGIIGIALSVPMYVLSKSGLNIENVIMGGLMLVVMAGAIALSSHLLAMGNYEGHPSIGWALGVGASMLAFSIPMVALGFIALSGVGMVALGLGALSALIVAGTISGVSHIIASGNYSVPGDFVGWAKGTSLLFLTFIPSMLAMGALSGLTSLLSLGLAPDPIESGKVMMLKVASTIRDVSFVLANGKYVGGPSKEWSEGVGLAIGAFSPVFLTLQNMSGWFSSFSADDYSKAIITISRSIITAANEFNNAPSNWGGYPTKEWGQGVGTAIKAFAPIFEVLNSQGILDSIFNSSVTPEKMGEAIVAISHSIKRAGEIFSNDTTQYVGGPTKKWADGVGQSIQSFTSVYEWIFKGSNWTVKDIEQGNLVIYEIANGIKQTALRLEGINSNKLPDSSLAQNMLSNIKSWQEVSENINDLETDGITKTAMQMYLLSKGVESLAKSLSNLNTSLSGLNTEQLNALTSISGAFISLSVIDETNFANIMDIVEDKSQSLSELFGTAKEKMNNNEADSWWDKAKSFVGLADNTKAEIQANQGKSLDDVYELLEQMQSNLTQISSNSNNLSNYINELRANPTFKIK